MFNLPMMDRKCPISRLLIVSWTCPAVWPRNDMAADCRSSGAVEILQAAKPPTVIFTLSRLGMSVSWIGMLNTAVSMKAMS